MGDRTIDLSADVGEDSSDSGRSLDAALIEQITTAHIACGGHAGDGTSMAAAVEACVAAGTRVGAHPSYNDRAGFGRRPTSSAPREVAESVVGQVLALSEIAGSLGTEVHSVKPHGQLYHDLAVKADLRAAVLNALAELEPIPLVVLAASARMLEFPEKLNIRLVAEGFMDRRYDALGHLVSRSEPDAVLVDADAVAAQAARIASDGLSVEGIRVSVASLCVHSDSPGALASLVHARALLEESGFTIAPVS